MTMASSPIQSKSASRASLSENIRKFKRLLGPRVTKLFLGASGVGLLWFLIDSSFVLILQSFLISLGLVEPSKLNIPAWVPTSPLYSSLILVAFGALRGAIWSLRNFFAGSTAHAFVRYQRGLILRIGLQNADSLSSHDLVNTFSDHVLQAGNSLHWLSTLCVTITSVFLFSVYAFIIAPFELLTSFLIISIFIIPIRKFDRVIKESSAAIDRERVTVTKTLISGLKNNFLLKICGLVDQEIDRGQEALKRYESHYRKFEIVTNIRSAIPLFAGGLIIGCIYYISDRFFHTSAANLLTFFYLLLRIAQGSSEIVTTAGAIQVNFVAFRSIFELTERFREVEPSTSNSQKLGFQESVESLELEKVGFSYQRQSELLFQDLSFRLQKGDVLLIKGSSGTGKSTLLAITLGLLKPTQGKALINGRAAQEMFSSVSNHIGYVGPEPYLFVDSIRNNLLFGNPYSEQISDQMVLEILTSVGLAKATSEFQNGIHGQINDVAQFSTGQKQRLSIARALLRKPQLLLLDEATANLDVKTEESIISSLKNQFPQMITIIISHKNSFDSVANKTLTLGEDKLLGNEGV